MSLERILKAIMSIDLSETDAQVYVFLALNGPHKAKEITRKMNLYKEQLYRSINNLKNKDIVKATVDYPAVFYAVPFEVVLDLLAEIKKEQAQALQEIRKDLLDSWKETRARVNLMGGDSY
ncbi:MAG: helix-turn-helix domain-containing protein [Candidatus Bathyarchaeota archaeon]|nr:helix-turn-helix domain-containing protein [Candidatus Bathyarchaeota archaeon]